jgi:DNA modification methylase
MIILGDCYQELKKIESNSIDLILIDPPYLISKDSNFKKISDNTTEQMRVKYDISIDFGDWDKIDLDWNLLMCEYFRVLKKKGTIIIFYDVWKSNQLKEIASSVGFKQPRVCCWIKTNPVPINSKINYLTNSSEYFFTFVKVGNPTFNSEYDNGLYHYPICHGKERLKHPTQKPLRLISDIIQKHSVPGDIVLDSFAGTGTVGESCRLLDRRFVLIENNPTYFEMIKERLNKPVV